MAQVKTEVPPLVAGAKPALVERIRIPGVSLAGDLEGNATERDTLVILPSGYQRDRKRRYPVVYALHGYSIGAEQWAAEIHVPQTIEGAFASPRRRAVPEFRDAVLRQEPAAGMTARRGAARRPADATALSLAQIDDADEAHQLRPLHDPALVAEGAQADLVRPQELVNAFLDRGRGGVKEELAGLDAGHGTPHRPLAQIRAKHTLGKVALGDAGCVHGRVPRDC
jgi:hypothetical protein